MTEAILVALISGGISLIGTAASFFAAARKNESALKISQAVTDTKIEELTREVREHNRFASRMPVMEEQIRTLTAEVSELKGYHRPIS